MARVVDTSARTPADELRDLLARSERLVGNLRGTGPDALELLHMLDRMAELFPRLEADGVDLRPERGRLEGIEGQLSERAALFVREASRLGALQHARAERRPSHEAWWWRLDKEVARRRRQRLTRVLGTITGIVLVLVIGNWLLHFLFPPDPVAVAQERARSNIQTMLEEGDYHGALAQAEAVVAEHPEAYESWLYVGALRERVENPFAEDAFENARVLINDDALYHVARAQVYQIFGDFEAMKEQAELAIAINPELPEAYFMLAGALEELGDWQGAMDAFERTAELAETGDIALVVMARVRLGMLMQRMPAFDPEDGPTPTPFPELGS